jgi:hypothetical protein
VTWLLIVPVRLKIFRLHLLLPFCFGTARPELDERECIEDRTRKDGTTTWTAGVSCATGGTITLGVTYGTNYLSTVSAAFQPRGRLKAPTPVMMTTANNPAIQPVMA